MKYQVLFILLVMSCQNESPTQNTTDKGLCRSGESAVCEVFRFDTCNDAEVLCIDSAWDFAECQQCQNPPVVGICGENETQQCKVFGRAECEVETPCTDGFWDTRPCGQCD